MRQRDTAFTYCIGSLKLLSFTDKKEAIGASVQRVSHNLISTK